MSMAALEWLPTGVNFLNALVSLATVEIELSAGEAAGRLLGQSLLELEAVRDAQQGVPLHLASASFAIWRGDLADARRAAERGWALVRDTEDWILVARDRVDRRRGRGGGRGRSPRAARPGRARGGARPGTRGQPGGRGQRPQARRRTRARLASARRRVAGHGAGLSPPGRWPGRPCRLGSGRRPVGGPADPVRAGPRALARGGGEPGLRARAGRSGGCADPLAEAARARPCPRRACPCCGSCANSPVAHCSPCRPRSTSGWRARTTGARAGRGHRPLPTDAGPRVAGGGRRRLRDEPRGHRRGAEPAATRSG